MPTVENIATTTLQLIRRRLADNIFKANPLAAWLLMRGRVKTASGGKRIEEPLIYATNNTIQAYTGYDRLNVNPTQELTNAQYQWRQIAGSVSMSGLEELMNSGESAVFNLLQAKIRVAEMSMKQFLAEKLLAGTATKDTTRDFLGLAELVEAKAPASQSTVGGIDKATESWWQNKFVDEDGAAWSSSVLLSDQMTKLYLETTKGLSQPDIFLTDQRTFQQYEDENRDKLRFSDTNLMDVGFTNFRFKKATLMWDENIMSGNGIETSETTSAAHHIMYSLNSEFLSLTLHPRRNFVMTPFITPTDQDAKVAQILVAGNMTCSNMRFQGVLLAKDA